MKLEWKHWVYQQQQQQNRMDVSCVSLQNYSFAFVYLIHMFAWMFDWVVKKKGEWKNKQITTNKRTPSKSNNYSCKWFVNVVFLNRLCLTSRESVDNELNCSFFSLWERSLMLVFCGVVKGVGRQTKANGSLGLLLEKCIELCIQYFG